MENNNKRLERSRTNRVIAGVCAGLADYFKIDIALMRVLFVVATICGSFGFWMYVILWIVVPEENILGPGSSSQQGYGDTIDITPKDEKDDKKSVAVFRHIEHHQLEGAFADLGSADLRVLCPCLVFVVIPEHDLYRMVFVIDILRIPDPEDLPDPEARLCRKQEKKLVPYVVGRADQLADLLFFNRFSAVPFRHQVSAERVDLFMIPDTVQAAVSDRPILQDFDLSLKVVLQL